MGSRFNGDGFEGGLDDYTTLKSLRRYVALFNPGNSSKPRHKHNEDLAKALSQEVSELIQTMRSFGIFSPEPNIKRDVDFTKRLRSDLGDVFFYSFSVANSLNMDVSKAIYEKIKENERKLASGLKK